MRQIYSIGVIIVGMLTRELRRQAIFGHMPVPWCIMCGLWKTINKLFMIRSHTTASDARGSAKWKELGHSPHSPGLPSVPHATAD